MFMTRFDCETKHIKSKKENKRKFFFLQAELLTQQTLEHLGMSPDSSLTSEQWEAIEQQEIFSLGLWNQPTEPTFSTYIF